MIQSFLQAAEWTPEREKAADHITVRREALVYTRMRGRSIIGALALQAIGQLEELIFRGIQPHGGIIGDTEHFHRILVQAPLHIVITDAARLDLSVYPFEFYGSIVIGQVARRNFNGDQLRLIVFILIQLHRQNPVILFL